MLQNIVFHDDIYQLARNIDLIDDGLKLDISSDLFYEKLYDDILFCNMVSQKIFEKLHNQSHLPEYVDAMSSLFNCMQKFISILLIILENENHEILNVKEESLEKCKSIKAILVNLKHQISDKITSIAGSHENTNMVSEVELTQLLKL